MTLTIDELKKSVNIAELLDNQQLARISDEVKRGYQIDNDSRSRWNDIMSEATDVAMMILEEKDFPWEGASNVMYPLVVGAAIDYSSRTSPEILRGGNTFMAPKIIGKDPEEKKLKAGKRVCDYMSYDLNYRSSNWKEGTDKLLQILPVVGTVFKKTYYNEVEKTVCSELCTPNNIIVNANIKSLKDAPRITHRLKFYKNDVVARQRKGIFREYDNRSGKKEDINVCLGQYGNSQDSKDWEMVDSADANKQMDFLEQCCYLDLDDDGYKEPYIVTMHEASGTIYRIVANFDKIELNKDKKVQRIIPCYYYTDYHFIRSSDGSYYSIGFGALLLPLNNSINTAINMLFNAGTLCTTPGGLIGSGVRFKNGQVEFKLGRYQHVSTAPGEEIAKNIYPWPAKEPSPVLFQLLGLLIQAGKELASTVDMPKGGQDGSMQNVASKTVEQYVEQGSKMFVAINNRVTSSLGNEFMKIYYLHSKHINQNDYMEVLDDPEANMKEDFNVKNMNIITVADPSISSETQRVFKASMVLQTPGIDVKQASRKYLQSLQIDDAEIEKLLPEQQQPSPEQQKIMVEIQEMQTNMAKISAEATLASQEMQLKFKKLESDNRKNEAMIAYYQHLCWQILKQAELDTMKNLTTRDKAGAQEATRSADLMRKTIKDQHDMQMEEISKIQEQQGLKIDEMKTIFDMYATKQEKQQKEGNEDDNK